MHVFTLLLLIDFGVTTRPTTHALPEGLLLYFSNSWPSRILALRFRVSMKTVPSSRLDSQRQRETNSGSVPSVWIPPQPHRFQLFLAAPTLYLSVLHTVCPVDCSLQQKSEIACFKLFKQLLQLLKSLKNSASVSLIKYPDSVTSMSYIKE